MEDNDIIELEQQTHALIHKYTELKRKNSDLSANQSDLLEERSVQRQRNQQAAEKIKEIINRLKTVEVAEE